MADQAAKETRKLRARAGRSAYPIANGVTVYEGMLGSLEGGYLNHWADGAADVPAGVVSGGGIGLADDAILLGDTSLTPLPEAYVDDSGVTLMRLSIAGTATQAKVGDLVYSATSNPDDITLTIGALNHPIGWMSRYRSATDVDVTLFTPSEALAQITA